MEGRGGEASARAAATRTKGGSGMISEGAKSTDRSPSSAGPSCVSAGHRTRSAVEKRKLILTDLALRIISLVQSGDSRDGYTMRKDKRQRQSVKLSKEKKSGRTRDFTSKGALAPPT